MFYPGTEHFKIVGGPVHFYEDYALTSLYVERTFGRTITSLTVSNDSDTDVVSLSWDGATLEAELNPGESLTLNTKNKISVYVKSDAGNDNARLWGW